LTYLPERTQLDGGKISFKNHGPDLKEVLKRIKKNQNKII
jgi:hypothetical protein